MINNYVKTKTGEFLFFNDNSETERSAARAFAIRNATKMDHGSKPPARGGVSVFRSLAGSEDILEVGEVRDRKPDVQSQAS